MADPLLAVNGLTTEFPTARGRVRAVDDVTFQLDYGETLGLVGESGCGKSITALSMIRLVPSPGHIVAGEILLKGKDLRTLGAGQMRRVRGQEIGFVFQDPMSSLNPVLTIERQLVEKMRVHLGLSPRAARSRAAELLGDVGIPHPANRLRDYPHQFSGGMRQRVMIAIALSCNPALLIADEPTTALDVTIQAQILELIREMSAVSQTAVVLITHDLGIAAGMCDRVNVMYAGRVVESGPVDTIFDAPSMPYTRGLLDSLPRLGRSRGSPLRAIQGAPPDMLEASACRFAARCGLRRELCHQVEPQLLDRAPGHVARCWATQEGGWAE